MTRKPEQVIIGRVVTTHGIKGEVKVEVLTDFPERFAETRQLLLQRTDGKISTLDVERMRHVSGKLVVKFATIDTPEDAEPLRGSYILASTDDELTLGDGSFHSYDLEGLDVFAPDGKKIGSIAGIDRYPAQDILLVDTGETLLMVPAAREYLVESDIPSGRIVLDIPDGLPEQHKTRTVK